MAKRKKQISMVVTVSVPAWLTAAQARKEVRSLIGGQCFFGHERRDGAWEEIDSDNFKVREVTSVGAFVSRS